MRFQMTKDEKEKVFNKMLKQIRQEVKDIQNNDPHNLLSGCVILYYRF